MKRLALLEPGARVDRYVVLDILGQGGMAVVYRVRHQKLGSLHALKVVVVPSRRIMERLLQEGRSQARLRHRNVVQVNDVIEVDGSPGLVMEYVPGPNLEKLIHNVPLDLETVDRLGRQILRGIAAAHDVGLIHRDLKPANILCSFTEEGLVPKIADFGLVKDLEFGAGDTRTGSAMGTPNYMSPEQIRDTKSVDARTDLFACGAILYELLTRRVAFSGDDLLAIFNCVAAGRHDPVRLHRPDAPDRMVAAIERALKVEREERASSASELLEIWCGNVEDQELSPAALPASTLEWIRSVTLVPPEDTPVPTSRATISVDDDPSEPAAGRATLSPAVPRPRRWWPVALGLATAGLVVGCLGVGGVGLVVGGGSWLGSVGPRATPVSPRPAPVPTPEPQPEPAPEPEVPVEVPVPPTAPPLDPRPPPPAGPRPPVPAPAPDLPVPVPAPPVPPPPEPPPPAPVPVPVPGNLGAVSVSGANSAMLEGPAGMVQPSNAVPAGHYTVLADFGRGAVRALEIEVVAGRTTRVSCAAALQRCSVTK